MTGAPLRVYRYPDSQDPDAVAQESTEQAVPVNTVMVPAGTQKAVTTTLIAPMNMEVQNIQTAITSDTAAALQEAVSGSRMAAITTMWDSLVVPERKPDEPVELYVVRLRDTIKEVAAQSNRFEGAAQSLAEANVRQSKIIAKLRGELTRIRCTLLSVETQLNQWKERGE